MAEKKLLTEMVSEIEAALVERGQSENGISQYHYIFRVFLSYSKSFGEREYNRDVLERCLREHYKIMDETVLSRRQHYKKKVARAFRMLCDHANGAPFESRYMTQNEIVETDEYINAVSAFTATYQKSGHRPKTLELYRGYAEHFLGYAEQNNVYRLADISAELISGYMLTLSDYCKSTVKSTLGGLRIFFKFLYLGEYVKRDLSALVVGIRVRSNTKIPSVWSKDEVLKLLASIDRANPSGKRDYAILLLVARLGHHRLHPKWTAED